MKHFDENEFILKIDNSFPYKDDEKWKALVDEGASISPNASYMVLHEICRPPKRPRITGKQRLDMLEY